MNQMKKYSLYLRQDQIAFLKSLSNASSFMREALDQFLAKLDRTEAEKLIVLYQGAEELEDRIEAQELLIERNMKKTEEIDKAIEKAQLFLRVARAISDGKFQIEEQYDGTFRVLFAKEDGKFICVTDKHETEEEARTRAIERGKSAIKGWKAELEEAKKRKRAHQAYLEAKKGQLIDMQRNLEKLYASME